MPRLMTNPDIVLREEFDDYAILFNPDTGEAVGLNPTGVAVWKRIDGQRTLAQIAEEIAPLFGNTPDTVAADVERFAQELVDSGFVGQLAGTESQ